MVLAIGSAVVRRLLADSDALVFNLDKMGYASDLTSIRQLLDSLGSEAERGIISCRLISATAAVRAAVDQNRSRSGDAPGG